MAFTPGFTLPYGIQTNNPYPVDAWSGPYEGLTTADAIAAANLAVLPGVRFLTMEVRLIVNGVAKKYWYKYGTSDADLIEMSADWDSVYASVKATSANWDSVYASAASTSASWDSVYASVASASASWDSVYSSNVNTSANWDSVYSSNVNTSANWDSVYASVAPTSANWDSTYSAVANTSATWGSVYSTFTLVSSSQYSPLRKFQLTDDGYTTYSGVALYPAVTTDPMWKITKLQFTLVGVVSSKQIQDAAIWDNRTSYF